MTNPKRATLADVARRAGLSTAAASLILNDRPDTRLSPDARERVLKAAAELGYRPNVAARGLRTSITNTIGFISDDVSVTRFASGLIRGALRAAEGVDHVLLVIETGDDRVRESRAVDAVLDRQVDGIIFAAMRAREIEIPPVPPGTRTVLLNATSATARASVLPAEFDGGRTAIETLVRMGHRSGIVMVGQDANRTGDTLKSRSVEARVSGIFAEMNARGLAFDAELAVADWNSDSAYGVLRQYLSTGRTPRCVLVLNDPMAFGVYRALAEFDLTIPGDVSVLSFDNDELGDYLRPRLTTVGLPFEAMGEAAVELLLSGTDEDRLVPMPVVFRDSLAGPSARTAS
ncbi:MAG TPA: LacI family DNA-binding transcriptional regulator [Microbacterium sp.]|uniref:LacI family DNA-binding transcriptional regulator n=1 Tax=Microbacterium sp. TaxID=51671 RepID=UPI002C1AACD2|nr:LacI family DNA-binding transcriptional regulator [Microbacterium sp.]HWI31989.1 LacI family DNA-binding transcriptional regulator [Microbacterium sp.]